MPEGPRTRAEVRKWVDLGFDGFPPDGFEPEEVVAVIPEPLEARESTVRNGSTPLTELILDAMRQEAGTDDRDLQRRLDPDRRRAAAGTGHPVRRHPRAAVRRARS